MNYLDRSLKSVSSRIIPVQPFDYVVFGATGDLTKRKLMPALYNLMRKGRLPSKFNTGCVGFGSVAWFGRRTGSRRS